MQDDLLAYYGMGAEPTRLDTGVGALEYDRTRDTIRRGRVRDEALFANVLDQTASGRRVAAERRTSPFPDSYFHLPEELEEEIVGAGLALEGIYGLEGPGSLLHDRDPAWPIPRCASA